MYYSPKNDLYFCLISRVSSIMHGNLSGILLEKES